MNAKFVSYRRDIISYTSCPIDKLFCFKIVENRLVYDKSKTIKGRSFYIYKDKESIDKFINSTKYIKYQKLENFKQEVEKAKKDVK